MDHPSGWKRSGYTIRCALRASPPLLYFGDVRDRTEIGFLAAELHCARMDFKAATAHGDFGAAIAAELTYYAKAEELRQMFSVVVLQWPDARPFTDAEIEDAMAGVRRWIDRDMALGDEEEEGPG